MKSCSVESLENRRLFNVTLGNVADTAIPGGQSVFVPLRSTTDGPTPIIYAAGSSNPAFQVQVMNNVTWVQMDIAIDGVAQGSLQLALFRDIAPNTVARITDLVNSGKYNNLTFHRIIPGFMAQGGDPSGDGSGGSGVRVDDEFNAKAIFSTPNLLAMANSNSGNVSDTGDQQFFITAEQTRWLDFQHTIFGMMVRGRGLFNNMMSHGSPAGPVTGSVVITSARIVQNSGDTVLSVSGPATGSSTITVVGSDVNSTKSLSFTANGQTDTTTTEAPFLNPLPADYSTYSGMNVNISLSATTKAGHAPTFAYLDNNLGQMAMSAIDGNVVSFQTSQFVGTDMIKVGVYKGTVNANYPTYDANEQYNWDTQWIRVSVAAGPFASYNFANRALTIEGTSGDDVTTLVANGNDLAVTENGITLHFGLNGIDSIAVNGKDGNDKITVSSGIMAVSVMGGAGNDTLIGGDGADTLDGGVGDDYIDGMAGNDVIRGGNGNDIIFAGAGDDWINGNAGNDTMRGGDGNDTIYGSQGDDWINGNAGNDLLSGGLGNDLLHSGRGFDTMSGNAGKDQLISDFGFGVMYSRDAEQDTLISTANDFTDKAQIDGSSLDILVGNFKMLA